MSRDGPLLIVNPSSGEARPAAGELCVAAEARGIRCHVRAAPRFRIEVDGPRVVAAADGEPLTLEAPLEVECPPRALRVLVPRA